MSNNATLNQLCIQAHSSSLRCGGSLCKVQSDRKENRHSVLDTESPANIEGFKLFRPLAICPTMRFRVGARNDRETTVPHPNPPRVGEGAITLHNPFNYATLNRVQSDRKENRHSVLDTESPSSSEGIKIIPCLTKCPTMRL